MSRQCGGTLLFGMLLWGRLTMPAEYVVAPSGADDNPGSREAPFRTIRKAAQTMKPGDVCVVRGGRYSETIRPSTDGVQDRPVVFRVAPGETAVISGADAVTGWERWKGPIHRARMDWDLGENNQIFVNGNMAPEARWPNSEDDDLLTPEGARITRGGTDFITCDELPGNFADDFWKGAVIWVLAGARWTSWTSVVDAYDAREKTLRFGINRQGSIPTNMNPGHRRGGVFVLTGKLGALDAPNEWFYDPVEKWLYLYPPDGADPDQLNVTARRRRLAFDLTGKLWIHVIGFNILGAALDLHDATHCLVQDVRARHISHTRGGATGYRIGEPTGIRVGGHDNIVRDCELAYSVGHGVVLTGQRNAVINCWIHDINYLGCYGAPVSTSGFGHLVSHNTIHDTGRDGVVPRGQAHLIAFNNIFRMGRICHDLGGVYVVASDGGGTELRNNWVHDNQAAGARLGIYLDNFTSNYVIHHNVCWDTGKGAIRLNKPSLYNVVAHNTVLGSMNTWGRWPEDWMYGCVYASNLLTAAIQRHPQLALAGNVEKVPAESLTPENFAKISAGADKGVAVPGITGAYLGTAPDAGAYEHGAPPWNAGHDFADPPKPVWRLAANPFRNRIRHGSFDWDLYRGELGPWRQTHGAKAEIIAGKGGIAKSYATRNTIIRCGLRLQGDGPDGIEQTVQDLEPNSTFDLTGWVKTQRHTEVRLGILFPDGKQVFKTVASEQWTQARVRFETSATITSAVVYATKSGPGAAYADDLALVAVLPAFAPGNPGPLP